MFIISILFHNNIGIDIVIFSPILNVGSLYYHPGHGVAYTTLYSALLVLTHYYPHVDAETNYYKSRMATMHCHLKNI